MVNWKDVFIDLHCHPAMKPFGQSFRKIPGQNSERRRAKYSIWHDDRPTSPDKLKNLLTGITKFTQSDFTTSLKGGCKVLFVSLYPLEKSFVLPDNDNKGWWVDAGRNFAMGLSKKRIDHLQSMPDYFTDLQSEYRYYTALHGSKVRIGKESATYYIVNCLSEIERYEKKGENALYIVLNIEGGHVFNCGLQKMNRKAGEQEVLSNIQKVKKWKFQPFTLGLAHHFYNELTGHARSLPRLITKRASQKEGMDGPITKLGERVIQELLDKGNGRRILIDIKHLSVQARRQYFDMIEAEHKIDKVPLVVSHGAVNGLRSIHNAVTDNKNMINKLNRADINFFDEEIVTIALSKGIFGIQMDERRVANDVIKQAGRRLSKRQMLYHRSKFIWNQIQHIAETLNNKGLYAWGIQSIGSDFDGIINPVNGFWTAREYNILAIYIETHAHEYMNSSMAKALSGDNRIDPAEITRRFMWQNAYLFMRRWF